MEEFPINYRKVKKLFFLKKQVKSSEKKNNDFSFLTFRRTHRRFERPNLQKLLERSLEISRFYF